MIRQFIRHFVHFIQSSLSHEIKRAYLASNSDKMKQVILLLAVLAIFSIDTSAQLGGLVNKVKNKAQQRLDRKVDNAIDKTLDEAEGKKSPQSNGSSSGGVSSGSKKQESDAPEENGLKSYSKFDFIPGEAILYSEDFQQDEIGEFPLNWNTAGKGEVVTLSNFPGKWLRMFENSMYLTSNKALFTKNFTLEFDLVLDMKYNGYTFPMLSFGFLATAEDSSTDNKFLDHFYKYQAAEVFLRFGTERTSYTYMYAYNEGKRHFTTDNQELHKIENFYGKVSHVAVQVQEQRVRIWVNGEKKYDLPKAMGNNHIFNQIFFKLSSSSYKDDELGFYVSNLKVATGKPDTRHKLVEEGKFSTTGILFDFQSAVIKPESYGVVKEIAGVLKDNGSIRIKVLGHTSNDGDDNANMELSRKRAAAVKDLLVSEFSIDASRIETEGKGETQPIADNKTKEGKSANRRVEFIKL